MCAAEILGIQIEILPSFLRTLVINFFCYLNNFRVDIIIIIIRKIMIHLKFPGNQDELCRNAV